MDIIQDAFAIFDDLEARDFKNPPFSLGGGTVLMLNFQHRLSKDIDFFSYDAQWLTLLSPRLNDKSARIASSYSEQSSSLKLVTEKGDIDFIIAADVILPVHRQKKPVGARMIDFDPAAEILAKKLFYRAASFKPRDVYDLSAAIDLDPMSARLAVRAASPKREILNRRLEELSDIGDQALLKDILPYEGPLRHADHMVGKVMAFISSGGGRDDPTQSVTRRAPRNTKKDGYKR